MQFYAAKIVLLLAVVTGQIVGGSSCCCFTRFLAGIMDSAPRTAVSRTAVFGKAVFGKDRAEKYSCPKCCRQQVETSKNLGASNVSKLSYETARFSGNDKCNCVRHMTVGTTEVVPKCGSINQRVFDQHLTPSNLNPFNWLLTIQKKAKCSYSPPLCYWPVKCTWQCLVCIWIA